MASETEDALARLCERQRMRIEEMRGRLALAVDALERAEAALGSEGSERAAKAAEACSAAVSEIRRAYP